MMSNPLADYLDDRKTEKTCIFLKKYPNPFFFRYEGIFSISHSHFLYKGTRLDLNLKESLCGSRDSSTGTESCALPGDPLWITRHQLFQCLQLMKKQVSLLVDMGRERASRVGDWLGCVVVWQLRVEIGQIRD